MNISINEQITFLRKQRGMTQEGLAKAVGVTNQAVSKWESGQCCPDIQILPVLADIFDVSTDTLLGRKTEESFEELCLRVKSTFKAIPNEEIFSAAFMLSAILHEAVATGGYKESVPWNTDNTDYKRGWFLSARSNEEGHIVRAGNGIFISDGKTRTPPRKSEIHRLRSFLEDLSESDVLSVMFALYGLIADDSQKFVTVEEIAEAAVMSADRCKTALRLLPIVANDDMSYRLEGSFMHVPPLILMLRQV